eukprot:scaffold43225_cov23-Cyclotella_meneghiniana.AAC.1
MARSVLALLLLGLTLHTLPSFMLWGFVPNSIRGKSMIAYLAMMEIRHPQCRTSHLTSEGAGGKLGQQQHHLVQAKELYALRLPALKRRGT